MVGEAVTVGGRSRKLRAHILTAITKKRQRTEADQGYGLSNLLQ